jgi:uncharacterized protein
MIEIFSLSAGQWAWLALAAIFIGISKAGIGGASIPVIPIIAAVFGGKQSTGIMLPMLIVADIFALYHYKRLGDWKDIKRLLPSSLGGLVLGAVVGNYISDKQFKVVIAFSVIVCLFLLIYNEKKGDNLKIPKGEWFHALIGAASGFTSMMGNAAGPLFSVYLLARGFKKNNFVGTNAWFFFIINVSKLPIQIFFWHNITFNTAIYAGLMIPALALGVLLGVLLIKKVNEKLFRYIIIGMTAASAIRLLI